MLSRLYHLIRNPLHKWSFSHVRERCPHENGPACLMMIADYYDIKTELDVLVKLSKSDPVEGTSLKDLSDAAEKIGLRSLGVKLDFDKLVNEVPIPVIIYFTKGSFAVVYNITHLKIWIADPSIGKYERGKREFCDSWYDFTLDKPEGYALLLEPLGR